MSESLIAAMPCESRPDGGVGRPTAVEITRQREDFRALVAAGVPLVDAARRAGCKPERALAEVEVIVRSILERAA